MLKPVRMDTTVTVVSPWDPAFDESHVVRVDESSPEIYKRLLAFCHEEGVVDPDVDELPSREVYQAVARTSPGAWSDLLKRKPGQDPTVFRIGAIPPGELNRIEHEFGAGTDGNKARDWECFKASLRDIENGPRTEDGRVPKSRDGGVARVRGDWIEQQFGGGMMRMAGLFVGAVAWAWNNLTGEDAKN